jgi:hypothetical protein
LEKNSFVFKPDFKKKTKTKKELLVPFMCGIELEIILLKKEIEKN